jgi:hypothetical protein
VDVATNSNFTQFVQGYKGKSIGTNSIVIQNLTVGLTPDINAVRFVGKNGFILEWDKDNISEAYKVDVSYDINFNTPLANYQSKLTDNKFMEIGGTDNLQPAINTQLSVNNSVTVNNSINPISNSIITGIFKTGNNYPQLDYFLEESSIRFYRDDSYSTPAIVEDVEILKWHHVAIVNRDRYTYLYFDGELVDKVKNVAISNNVTIGYNIGFLKGYITAFRITKGIARYIEPFITVPTLPFPIN